MSDRMEKTREALKFPDDHERYAAALAEVEEWETRLAAALGMELEVVMDDLRAAEAERDRLRDAIHALVNAAEALSRPGSQGNEMVNAAAMTNALTDAAKLVGNVGIFPELGAS